jgi:hypothetical protein
MSEQPADVAKPSSSSWLWCIASMLTCCEKPGTPRSHGFISPSPQRTLRTDYRPFDSSSTASGIRRRQALLFLSLPFRIIAPQ